METIIPKTIDWIAASFAFNWFLLPTYREINEFTPAPIPVPIPAKIRNNGVTKPIAASGLGPNPATQYYL